MVPGDKGELLSIIEDELREGSDATGKMIPLVARLREKSPEVLVQASTRWKHDVRVFKKRLTVECLQLIFKRPTRASVECLSRKEPDGVSNEQKQSRKSEKSEAAKGTYPECEHVGT